MFLLLLLGGLGLGTAAAVSAAKGPERRAIHKEKKARRLERRGRRAPKAEALRSTAALLRKKKEDRRRERMGAVPLFPNGRERLVGGRADWMPDSDFDQRALRKGMRVELEHTTDLSLAKEIAKDHLSEDPRYYDMLEQMERGFRKR